LKGLSKNGVNCGKWFTIHYEFREAVKEAFIQLEAVAKQMALMIDYAKAKYRNY
jgi:hypothetical protein